MKISKQAARPPIHLIDSEADRLADLAMSIEDRSPDISALLLGEIDRAKLVPCGKIPADVVVMNADVEFVDEGSQARRSIRLVYPKDADVSAGRISVLTHAGAGLIGMRAGQSILWPDRDGRYRKLSIISVRQPAAGEDEVNG